MASPTQWTWCVCAQSCVSLCDSLNYSTPDSSVHGISQASILEWVAILFQGIFLTQGSNLCCLCLLHYRLILYPVSHPGMLFSDQSCPFLCDSMVCPWNSLGKNTGVGCHSLLQDLPDTGIKPWSPALQADFLSFVLLGKPPMDMSLSQLQEIVG